MIDCIVRIIFTLHLSIHSTSPYGLRRTLEMSGAKNCSSKFAHLEWPPKFLRRWMYREVGFALVLVFALPACATVQQFEQQVANNPDDVRALYNVGVAAFKADDLEKAASAFNCLKPVAQEAAWHTDKAEQLFYNAGNTEVKLKKFKEAVESFEKVLEYNPDNELARKKLEYAKKMLEEEQKSQQQDQQKNQDKQEQEQDQDNKQQEEQQGDNDSSEQSGQDQQDQNKKDQQGQQNKKDGSDQQDTQGNQENRDEQQDPKNQEQQSHDTGNKDDQQQEQDQQQPELTEQEQRLMNALKKHDQDMSKEEMGQRMRQVAKGSAYAKNNW